jgi:hypothetical protein
MYKKHRGPLAPLRDIRDAPTKVAEKALKGKALSHGVSYVASFYSN